jgi:hypothetical protein
MTASFLRSCLPTTHSTAPRSRFASRNRVPFMPLLWSIGLYPVGVGSARWPLNSGALFSWPRGEHRTGIKGSHSPKTSCRHPVQEARSTPRFPWTLPRASYAIPCSEAFRPPGFSRSRGRSGRDVCQPAGTWRRWSRSGFRAAALGGRSWRTSHSPNGLRSAKGGPGDDQYRD